MTYSITVIGTDGRKDVKYYDDEEAYAGACADYCADCYDPGQYTRQIRGGDHAVFQHGDFRLYDDRE